MDDDEQPVGVGYLGVPDGVTPEEALGLNTSRIWANGIQVTASAGMAFFVFREQFSLVVEGVEGTEPTEKKVHKNVVSVVVPADAARQLIGILQNIFPETGGNESE